MQVSTNVDDLLEEWEQLKHLKNPDAITKDEIMAYICWKMVIDQYAQGLRNARLTNNKDNEQESTRLFIDAYIRFSQDFVFKVLKNDRKTQS